MVADVTEVQGWLDQHKNQLTGIISTFPIGTVRDNDHEFTHDLMESMRPLLHRIGTLATVRLLVCLNLCLKEQGLPRRYD